MEDVKIDKKINIKGLICPYTFVAKYGVRLDCGKVCKV
jgi:hypothetical protein